MSLHELFARKRAAREIEHAPKNVAAIAVQNAEDAFQHAQLVRENEAAKAVGLDEPETLDGTKPLFFEIRPSRVGVVEVFYSQRQGFIPKRILGEMRHQDLGPTLLKLLAKAQPPQIDIYNGIDGEIEL